MLIFQILGNADYVFTSIFTLEIILKVMQSEQCILSVSFSVSALSALSLFSLVSFALFCTLKPEIERISTPHFVLALGSGPEETYPHPPTCLEETFGCQGQH